MTDVTDGMFQKEVLNQTKKKISRRGEILVQMFAFFWITDVTDGMLQKEVLNH